MRLHRDHLRWILDDERLRSLDRRLRYLLELKLHLLLLLLMLRLLGLRRRLLLERQRIAYRHGTRLLDLLLHLLGLGLLLLHDQSRLHGLSGAVGGCCRGGALNDLVRLWLSWRSGR